MKKIKPCCKCLASEPYNDNTTTQTICLLGKEYYLEKTRMSPDVDYPSTYSFPKDPKCKRPKTKKEFRELYEQYINSLHLKHMEREILK